MKNMKKQFLPFIMLLFMIGCSTENISLTKTDKLPEEQVKQTEEANTPYETDEFLLPSDSSKITNDEIEGYNETELNYAYAEIFARHGKIFDDLNLVKYFTSKAWYVPNPRYNENDLSELEKENAEIILTAINKKAETETEESTQQTTTQETTTAVISSADIAAAYAKSLGFQYCIYDIDKDGQEDIVVHCARGSYNIYMNHGGNFTYAGNVFSDGGPSDYADGKIYKSKRNGFYVTDMNTVSTAYRKYEVYNNTVVKNEADMVSIGIDYYVDNQIVSPEVCKNNVDIIESNVMVFGY